jgi:hypothetical protein
VARAVARLIDFAVYHSARCFTRARHRLVRTGPGARNNRTVRTIRILWLLLGIWLWREPQNGAGGDASDVNERLLRNSGAPRFHHVLAQSLNSLGIIALLFLPGVIHVAHKPATETFFSAAAQALPALLIAVALGFWGVLRFFGSAYGRPGAAVSLYWACLVSLCVWASLIGAGTCFVALAQCSHGKCGSPQLLDRVDLGLSAAYLLVALLVGAAFQAVLRGRVEP